MNNDDLRDLKIYIIFFYLIQSYDFQLGQTQESVRKPTLFTFRCIHKSGGMLLFTPAKSVQIITAVFELQNLCMDIKLPVDDIELNFRPDQGVPQPGGNGDAAGQTVRQRLIQRFALYVVFLYLQSTCLKKRHLDISICDINERY